LRIETAEDLEAVVGLDEPFWMATSAPVDELVCDPVLLARLDRCDNKRVQSWEIRDAIVWLLGVMQDRRGIAEGSDTLDLNALDISHDAGAALHQAGLRILANLGLEGQTRIGLEQVRDRQGIFARGTYNGDGVIPAGSAGSDALNRFIEDIIATVGAVDDRNGTPGVNEAQLDLFLSEARSVVDAYEAREARAADATLLPLGDATGAVYQLYEGLRQKLDEYFELCRLAALEQVLGGEEISFARPSEGEEGSVVAILARAPLARPTAARVLPVTGAVNPHYADVLSRLAVEAFAPLLGEGFDGVSLTEAQWREVAGIFSAYEVWAKPTAQGQVDVLGIEQLKAYLESDLPERLRLLFAEDFAAGKELGVLQDLEYLILLQRWIIEICNNFVSFPYLYDEKRRAMFEAGKVIMDGREFNMNFRVKDLVAHSATAARSRICLLYSEVTGASDGAPFYIVTPVTAGRLVDFGVGRRGVLFDQDGKEWDTRVVRVVENPVNLPEAIVAPFKRIGALIFSTAERITTSTEQQVQGQITQASTSLETGIKEGIAADGAPVSSGDSSGAGGSGVGFGRVRDMVLTGGVAVAALGSAFAYITKTFGEMGGIRNVVVAVAVGLGVILIPTVVLQYIRLRSRNLSAVLEASGWAVNAPMRLTWWVRYLICRRPPHPGGFV